MLVVQGRVPRQIIKITICCTHRQDKRLILLVMGLATMRIPRTRKQSCNLSWIEWPALFLSMLNQVRNNERYRNWKIPLINRGGMWGPYLRADHKKVGRKRGSITYGSDRTNEINKMFISGFCTNKYTQKGCFYSLRSVREVMDR